MTIEDICEPVGISKRTFFNYFASKEEAIIGPGPRVPSREELDEFLASPHQDIFVSTLRFFYSLLFHENNPFNWTTMKRRHKIKEQEPELSAHQIGSFHSARHQVEDLLTQYFLAFPADIKGGRSAQEEARLVTGGVIMCMLNGAKRWEETGNQDPDAIIAHSLDVRQGFLRVLAVGVDKQSNN